MNSHLKGPEEFSIGKHGIGYMNGQFAKFVKEQEFEVTLVPTFQKLPRAMGDAAIEKELKPGTCSLGDIMAFLDTAPEECKDGYANLFYFEAFVVGVYWSGFLGYWYVSSCRRGDDEWGGGRRVFSPATGSFSTQSSPL